jgi:hypothetical protein
MTPWPRMRPATCALKVVAGRDVFFCAGQGAVSATMGVK